MKSGQIIATGFAIFGMIIGSGLSRTSEGSLGQSRTISSGADSRVGARPVTIPVSINVKGIKPEPELQMIDLVVSEDNEPQTILSIRAIGNNSPLTFALLIQDDLVSSIGNEIKPLGEFIRRLPKGSRVLVGYLRTGSLQVRQKFTSDLEKASKSLRVPVSSSSASPYNPYVEVIEAIKRFDSQPSGRRAILLISDGLDTSHGIESSSAGQSIDLQRAITESQRRSIAVYSFYAPSVGGQDRLLAGNAQGSLEKLSEETGGKAFFQGFGAPVSFDPFIKGLTSSLEKQVALTYLSTHPEKGFHRIKVRSATQGVEVDYPAGYTR